MRTFVFPKKIIAKMIKCPYCEKQIPYDANVCPYCGRSIKEFHQKDNAEGEQSVEHTDPEPLDNHVERVTPHENDRRMLFFIIAVLVLLLIVGGIYHYTSIHSEDFDESPKAEADTTVILDTLEKIKPAAKVTYNAKKKQRVVVNGEGVRMRFGPSLKAGYLKDEKGATKSVKKGTELECVGQTEEWYQVVYMGKKYYMSKQFTYLVE